MNRSAARCTESIILGADPCPRTVRHPAKMHGGLAWLLINEYSAPGDVVIDPFAGSDTTGWAARELGRTSVSFDVEQEFCDSAHLSGRADARQLPLREGCADLVLTSPPYGEAIGRSGDRSPVKTIRAKADYEKRRFGRLVTKHAVYGFDPRNIGAIPLERKKGSCFVSVFPRVVREIKRVLKSEAYALVVVKDQRRGRKRLGVFDLPGFVVMSVVDAGMVFVGRRVAILPSSSHTLWQRVNESRFGIPIPDVEHVIVVRKI